MGTKKTKTARAGTNGRIGSGRPGRDEPKPVEYPATAESVEAFSIF